MEIKNNMRVQGMVSPAILALVVMLPTTPTAQATSTRCKSLDGPAGTIRVRDGHRLHVTRISEAGLVHVEEDVYANPKSSAQHGPTWGACCHPATGSCMDGQTADACFADGGDWYTCLTCEDIDCPPLAACCIGARETCVEAVTFEECIVLGGTLWGMSSCDDIPCTLLGACCDIFSSACTDETTLLDCLDGLWAPGATCADDPCDLPAGACCDFKTNTCTDDVGMLKCFGFPSPGQTCAEVDCPATGACCDVLSGTCVEAVDQFECSAIAGWWFPNSACDDVPCPDCSTSGIIASQPPDHAVDARQPMASDGSGQTGWDSIQLTFTADMSGAMVTDFELVTSGQPLQIKRLLSLGSTVTLHFESPMEPGSCTTISHLPTASSVYIGYLPGDVNGDGIATPRDILMLIDHLNGALTSPLDPWQCDMDRSDTCDTSDVLRLIDLLTGAGVYDIWNGALLPECP